MAFTWWDNRAAAISVEKAADSKFNAKGSACTRESFDMLLSHCGTVIDAPPFFWAEELMKSYPQVSLYRFKQRPSSHSTCNDIRRK